MKLSKSILYGTILSILVFFSTSFLTLLFQINSPLNRLSEHSDLKIGFPLTYYHEFWLDGPFPNSGWRLGNLFWDCLLTWSMVTAIFIIAKRRKPKPAAF